MAKRIAAIAVAVCVALVSTGAAVSADLISRVKDIRSPLLNSPALVLRGGEFKLVVAGGKQVARAELSATADAAAKAPLSLAGSVDENGRAALSASVPQGAAAGLYDLSVFFADGSSDSQPHAVKVFDEFKKDFHFIHFTDMHFNTGDPEQNEARAKIIRSMCDSKPEFIVFSGDLGLRPATYDADYPFAYEQLAARMTEPVFLVPGNHEMYVDNNFTPSIDGLDYWNATFDVKNMSFDYGSLHVVGINNFEWEANFRDWWNIDNAFFGTQGLARIMPEQWKWLVADLKGAKGRASDAVAFMHVPLDTFAGGRVIGLKDRQKISGPDKERFVALMNEFGVSHVFVGHMHWNEEKQYGNMKQIMTLTAGSGGDKKWGYRKVYVKDGKVAGWDVITFAPDGANLTPID